jgi:hypothetical protein
MDIQNIFEYFGTKIEGFSHTKKKGAPLFTCPNIKQHKFQSKSPTATFIAGSDKIQCLICGWKGTIGDAIRILENKSMTDEEITSFIVTTLKSNPYPVLDQYEKYGFYLFRIAKNGKKPLKDEHWREDAFLNKAKWIQWLDNSLNLGLNCEKSNVMIIDVDNKEVKAEEKQELRDEIIQLLEESKTLMQNTPGGGRHYVYKLDKDLCFKQKVNLGGMKIDTRTDKGYFVVSPSKINDVSYNWVNIGNEIKEVPETLKTRLLSIIESEKDVKELPEEIPQENITPPQLKNDNLEGCCNDTFVRLGGIFLKQMPIETVKFVLHILNKNILETPMPVQSIEAMIGSLDGYKKTEETTQEQIFYDCVKLLRCDIHPKDVMEHTGLKRSIIDKYFSKFFKEGKMIRSGRGRYDFKDALIWQHSTEKEMDAYPYNIPYFNDIAYFEQGDIILIGGKTGEGKTHVAMNMIREMAVQGIKPYYIPFESGSRHKKIANALKLKDSDYYIPQEEISNPNHISLEDRAFTIIDWLYLGDDFAATPQIFNHFKDEMKKKGGILVVFTQLKEDYTWFAKNLIKDFVALSARHIRDDANGINSHLDVDKMRDPKGEYNTYIIPCVYNFETKIFKKKDIA